MAPYEVSLGGFEVKVNGAHLATDGMTLDEKVTAGMNDTPPTDTLYMQDGRRRRDKVLQ